MKLLAVKLQRTDVIDGLCGDRPGVEIQNVEASKGFFFSQLNKSIAFAVKKHPTA